MPKKFRLNSLRFTLAVLGILCLIFSLAQLTYFAIVKKPTEQESPVPIKHNVLFLSSFDSMHANYDEKKNGLQSVFLNNGIEFDICFMDVKSFKGDSDVSSFYTFFEERFNNNSAEYNGIVVSDDNALQFVMDHQEEFFKDLPIVFFAINNKERADNAVANPYITGVFEPDYIVDTVKTAMNSMPDRKTLVALHDESEAGLVDIEEFNKFVDAYPDYTVKELNAAILTMAEIIEELKSLPDDSIILFMACYNDATGHKYSLLDIVNIIKEYTDAPIMRNYVGGREIGILGGTYMNAFDQAEQAATILTDILVKGANVSDFGLLTDAASITCYNYELMKTYGVNERMLPKDTIYVNKPLSFQESYREMLPIVAFLIISMLCLISSLSFAFINEKNHVKVLEKSKSEIEKSRFLLQYQAEHDELLDLLNRRSILKYMRDNLKTDHRYSVMLFDIDGFKDVNENYGHKIGDRILNDIADRLKNFADSHNLTLGRYGGDEFIVINPGNWLNKDSEIVTGIVDIFNKPFMVEDASILLSTSAGISNSDGVTEPQDHILNAEMALFEAKEHGKNMVCIYADEMKHKLAEETNVKQAFLNALENDGLYMKYQPKVSAGTQEVIGYEALVRIKDSPYGPGQFIPIAEKNGWASKLGRATTALVVKQLAEWKKAGKTIYPVSVNYSSRQINDSGYVEFLESLLKLYEVDPGYIEIEITESLLMEESATSGKLFEDFRKLGIKLLLDDFGTGYSSLAYLTYVPVDNVKLDKSLVDTYLVEGKDAFIRDVIQLVHDIGKLITIEGVEEKWQYEKLREFNADVIQGYYFSMPLDQEEAIDFTAVNQDITK